MAQIAKASMHDFVTGEVVTEGVLDQNFELLRIAHNDTETQLTATLQTVVLGQIPDGTITPAKMAFVPITQTDLTAINVRVRKLRLRSMFR